jgi:hypothetical protein
MTPGAQAVRFIGETLCAFVRGDITAAEMREQVNHGCDRLRSVMRGIRKC